MYPAATGPAVAQQSAASSPDELSVVFSLVSSGSGRSGDMANLLPAWPAAGVHSVSGSKAEAGNTCWIPGLKEAVRLRDLPPKLSATFVYGSERMKRH